MAYSPNTMVRNAAGLYVPVGYGATDLLMPVAARDQNTSRNALIGTFQALQATPLIGLVNSTFYTTTSITDNYTTANTGSATTTVTANDGFALLQSGTTNPSTAQINSKDFATYNGIGELMFLNGLRAPQAGVAGCIRRWGYYDSNNGYFFEDNAGTFRVVSRKGGVDTAVASGSFNGLLGATYTLDQNAHFFQILMTGGRAIFMIDQVTLHTLATPAGQTTTSGSLTLSIRVEIVSTQTVNMTLELRGQNVGRLGQVDSKRLNETVLDAQDADLVRAVLTLTTGVANSYLNPTATPITGSAKIGQDVNLVSSQSGLPTTAATISAADVTTGGTASTTGAAVANVAPAGNVTASVTTSAFVGTLIFEASDDGGTSFYTYQVARDDGTGTDTTYAISTASLLKRMWTNGVGGGITHFRVRCSVFTSGTVAVRISPGVQLVDSTPSLGAGSASIGTVVQTLAPVATVGAASGNIAAPYYETNTAIKAAASVIAAPGVGLSIYVTDMEGSNEGATGTAVAFSEGAATPVRYRRFMAASGGGFVANLKTPWKLPANTALWAAVTAATTWNYTINYYIAP